MKDTKIRWAGSTWNPMTGCSEVSAECDNCYARVIAEKFGAPAFPNGFEPTFKPQLLGKPASWREPRRIFVNSMSDVHHEAFDGGQIDAVYDAMAETDRHDYLVLTKRPQAMARFFLGSDAGRTTDRAGRTPGWLERRSLDRVPDHVWLGTSIGLDRYAWRAKWLRMIPVLVRFLSCEPLLGPLPSLDLGGIAWVIVGGESGPGWRPMELDWARDLRDRCDQAEIAFYFKQSAAPRTEMGLDLDGRRHEEYPFAHPAAGVERVVGRYTDEAVAA